MEKVRLWGILRKRQRIASEATVDAASAELRDIQSAVEEISRMLDIPRPLWLHKQEDEIVRFGHTAFRADNFIEAIHFDRFELEILREEKRRSKDPYNDFS